jgi:sugar lactone lactonase YvrE
MMVVAIALAGVLAPPCIFHLATDPNACARQIRAVERPRTKRWISATAGQTLLYVSEPFGSAVSISTVGANAITQSGELTFDGAIPFSLAVGPSKNLYVALLNPSGPPSVEVFPRGSTKPSKVYTDGVTGPLDVAVDPHGTLYVANFVSSSTCNVLEYAKGSLKPTAVITDVPGCPNGVAVDASSNLYVTYIYYPATGPWQTGVMRYARGSTKGTRLNLKASGRNDFYGIAVDAKGNLVIANEAQDGMLYQILIFPRGSRAPAGGMAYGDGWFPLFFTLDGNRLFAPAYLEQGTASLMTIGDEPAEFDYPGGRERLVESPTLADPAFYYAFAISP